MSDFRVIVIGAGPAGIFAALTLAQLGVDRILLVDQGKDLQERNHTDILCGWGGAGAYSDGKLTLSPEVGGYLSDFLDPHALLQILQEADGVYVEHGAPDRVFGDISAELEALNDRARKADLQMIPTRIRHIGTENCRHVLANMRRALGNMVEIRMNCKVQGIVIEHGRIQGIRLADGKVVTSDFVVGAPGRAGAKWMKKEAEAIGLKTQPSPVDIGVRLELPAVVFEEITGIAYESKLIYYSKTFEDRVRTFCMNPYGEVVMERHSGITTVNGHSYADRKTENTNFAILVSSTFTEPFDDPIGYGLYIARLANLLGGGVIVQRLGDLLAGRRSNGDRMARCLTRATLADSTPGDLSFVLPFRHLQSITEMLQALDKLAPGVYSRDTLLYGVEIKFYSNRIQVGSELETHVKNLFVVGDGAGITRGLLQASASGMIAARAIAGRVVT